MLVKNNKEIFVFEKFLEYPDIAHGFSTRSLQTMKSTNDSFPQSVIDFAQKLTVRPQSIVRMNQIHSATVAWVSSNDRGKIVEKTDGLLSSEKNVFVSVITADCIPFLIFDPQKKIVGAVHAGWRGMFHEIIKEAIGKMVENGSAVRDIIVGIGPSNRGCCYEFGKDDIGMFQEKFSQWNDFIIAKNEKYFLDLPTLATHQLQSMGIISEHIEDGSICTVENLAEFYSYRKEKESLGLFMGIIGRIA